MISTRFELAPLRTGALIRRLRPLIEKKDELEAVLFLHQIF